MPSVPFKGDQYWEEGISRWTRRNLRQPTKVKMKISSSILRVFIRVSILFCPILLLCPCLFFVNKCIRTSRQNNGVEEERRTIAVYLICKDSLPVILRVTYFYKFIRQSRLHISSIWIHNVREQDLRSTSKALKFLDIVDSVEMVLI